jgi:hypothetical protein
VATVTDQVEGEEGEEEGLLDSVQLVEELRVDQECVCQTFIKKILVLRIHEFSYGLGCGSSD